MHTSIQCSAFMHLLWLLLICLTVQFKHFSTLQEAGRTALMFAAEDGNMEAVKLLISAGADVNIRDKVRNLSSCMIHLLYQS